jgi:hypothetical protein
MRFVLRLTGFVFLAIAVVAAVIDGTRSIAGSALVTTPLGQTWFQIHGPSLNIAQAAVERHVNPLLWDPVITSVLFTPTFVVAGVLALLFLVLGRPKRRPFEER